MVESWFPTLIFVTQVTDETGNNKLLAQRAYQLRDEEQGNVSTEWHCDTFNTLNIAKERYYKGDKIDTVIDNLKDFIAPLVHSYAKLFDADLDNYDIRCSDFWFNIAEPGAFQEYHQHPNNHFSVVYYVEAAENAGNIIFKSFESISDTCTIPAKNNKHESLGSKKSCFYEPIPGRLLIFRSNLLHMVAKNMSGKDRISIAINYEMVEKNDKSI